MHWVGFYLIVEKLRNCGLCYIFRSLFLHPSSILLTLFTVILWPFTFNLLIFGHETQILPLFTFDDQPKVLQSGL